MFTVGPYLFSGNELDQYLKARSADALAAAREGADAGKADNKGADIVRSLYDRFHIAETQMHVDKAYFTDERPLNDEECESIGVRGEDRTKYKSISIAVPYSGDEHLFTSLPTIYSAHQPQAELKEGALRLTWFLREEEEFQLENNFKRQIALIERTLEVTQWQAMGCNQDMMEALKLEVLGSAAATGNEAADNKT